MSASNPEACLLDRAIAVSPYLLTFQAIIHVIRQSGEVPSRIAVRHPILHSALEAYGKLLGIEIEPCMYLPAAEQAARALHHQMGGIR